MKSRQWLAASGLLVLVLAAIVGSFLTRDLGSTQSPSKSQAASGEPVLVDERPLQTARAMAKLASSADEQRVSDQAVQLADNEVDLAFRDASRDAADHPPQAKPQYRQFYEHVTQAEAQLKADQDQVDALKKQLASASVSRGASIQEQLDVAQAQLELDQDELNDAKEGLVLSGADPGSLIQRQFDQHQAGEHAGDEQPKAAAPSEVNYQAGSLIAQFATWRALRGKTLQLQQARHEAGLSAKALGQAHESLEKQVTAEKKQPQAPVPQAASQSSSSATANNSATLKFLHVLSGDQKNLADLDKRIQDEQQLQNTYGAWIALVRAHQRSALHGMVLSVLWILLVLLAVQLAGEAIDHYLAEAGPERGRLHTLRAVIRFAAQVLGVLLVLFVIFGPPRQIATIVGFAGAGLTVALKDFIVAFFGWFALMGKNGLRVGDWVEINGVAGEVIEINLLRTVLLETGNWTTTGHPTGRKVAFVNSYAIEGHFFNFTTSGQWLWDELRMMVPSDQDPYALIDAIQKNVAKETEENARAAEKEWQNATSHYRVQSVSAVPAVNLRPTPSGVEVHVRYITRAQERSAMRTKLSQALVQLLHGKGTSEKEDVSTAR